MFGFARKRAQGEVAHRYIDGILLMAVQNGADKIIFGAPCDDLPREPRRSEEGVRSELEEETEFEFATGTRKVPLWERFNGTWHEMPGPVWYALHEIVRDLGDRIAALQDANKQLPDSLEAIVPLKLKDATVKVTMRLALEPNYCYSVTLKKID